MTEFGVGPFGSDVIRTSLVDVMAVFYGFYFCSQASRDGTKAFDVYRPCTTKILSQWSMALYVSTNMQYRCLAPLDSKVYGFLTSTSPFLVAHTPALSENLKTALPVGCFLLSCT